MVMTITNFWKIFRYGINRDYCEKSIGIREFWNNLLFIASKILFQLILGSLTNNMPTLDEVDEGEIVCTCRVLQFSISSYPFTEVSTIYDITINRASSLDYTLVTSTIGSQHTAEKEGARE